MKYIITAKEIRNGRDHVTDPLERTEICTELILTRLKAIELLNTCQISSNDCIVTRNDRRCLYTAIFKNVIDWHMYERMRAVDISLKENTIDLVSQIYQLDERIPFKPFYQRFEEDKNEILNVDIKFHMVKDPMRFPEPFICILNRQTPNHPEKNLPGTYWSSVVDELCRHREVGFDKQVTVNSFGNAFMHAGKCYGWHITDFKDWCAIVANPNCKCVISTTTGGVYPIFFTGHPNSKLFIIDNNRLVAKHGDSPSFYNPCINFTRTQLKIVEEVPAPEDLVKSIIEYAEI